MIKKLLVALVLLAAPMLAQTPSVSGSLTASGSSCGIPDPTGVCVTLPISSATGGVGITLAGTFSATVQFEALGADGATWVAINAFPLNSTTAATSATSTGVWWVNAAGTIAVRARCSSFVSGSVSVAIHSSTASRSGGGGGGGGGGTLSFQGTPTASAIVTDFDATHIQTPSASSTLDSSGNAVFASTVTVGSGGGTGGNLSGLEGTCSGLATATYDVLCANSTSHLLEGSLNNGSMFPVETSQLTTQTTTYSAALNDYFIVCNSATPFTVTLPITNQITGKSYHIKNINSGTCTVAGASGNIDNLATFPLTQWQAISVVYNGSQYLIF